MYRTVKNESSGNALQKEDITAIHRVEYYEAGGSDAVDFYLLIQQYAHDELLSKNLLKN